MPDLPHGWRVRNSDGEVKGPPPEEDGFHSGDDSGSDFAEPLDIRPDSEGWEDAEDDSEPLAITCLLCEKTSSTAKAMLEHCNEAHGFDFLNVQRSHKLDFYSTIKLVNYVRSEALASKDLPNVSDAKLWEDDKYLQPTLNDDALLFSLDDVIDVVPDAEKDAQ